MPGPSQDRQRRLQADEPLHGHPARAPRVVELALERAAAAGAQARRQPRAQPRGEPLDEPPRHRLALRASRAPIPPPSRSTGPRSRSIGIASRPSAMHATARPPKQRRHQMPTRVVRRISTKATVHSVRRDDQPGEADRRGRHLLRDAGRDPVDQQDRAAAHRGDDVGRVDDARQQRDDLAPQLLARLERLRELRRARAPCRRPRAAGSRPSTSGPRPRATAAARAAPRARPRPGARPASPRRPAAARRPPGPRARARPCGPPAASRARRRCRWRACARSRAAGRRTGRAGCRGGAR